jgi:prepilin-type N-terminal cleavage/methylation domain-containing protein
VQKSRGFTLIELMIVASIIAIVAAIAIPGLLRARIASNETATIGTLRTLATSESQFQSAAVVDQDSDGTGEFGWLQELSGTMPYRVGGGVSAQPIRPGFITSVLGSTANAGGGYATKSGYFFHIHLPTRLGPAVAEPVPPGAGVLADADRQEVHFICYAWPTGLGNSGNRAFVISHAGETFATANKGFQEYRGLTNVPLAGAALFPGPTDDPQNLEGQIIAGTTATDGQIWIPSGG